MTTIPAWLEVLSWDWLILAGATALGIGIDIARGRRQPMRIMEAVWPVTALYFGPAVLAFYGRFGRASTGGSGVIRTSGSW